MQITAHNKQSVPDVALQAGGSLQAAFQICRRNDVAITEVLAAGEELELTDVDVQKREIVNIYAARKILPATALSAADEGTIQGGINYMGIEIDFIVR